MAGTQKQERIDFDPLLLLRQAPFDPLEQRARRGAMEIALVGSKQVLPNLLEKEKQSATVGLPA